MRTTRPPAWSWTKSALLPRSISFSVTPSPRRTSRVRGWTANARDSCTRSSCRSTMRTVAPNAWSWAAKVRPVGPAPTTRTSSGSPLAAVTIDLVVEVDADGDQHDQDGCGDKVDDQAERRPPAGVGHELGPVSY